MQLDRAMLALVEDDPIMGESLTQRLAIEGAKVLWWRTRSDAVSGLAACKPDAVLCDIRLPDGSGEEVFREAAGLDSPPAFLFMTAYSDIDQAVRLMKAGAGDYITKPFEMATLLQRLIAMLDGNIPRTAHIADLRGARGEAERAMIERTLIETQGRIGAAAGRLKVSRTTLWARMKALGISGSGVVQKIEQPN